MARRGIDIGVVNYQDVSDWDVFVFKPEGPLSTGKYSHLWSEV